MFIENWKVGTKLCAFVFYPLAKDETRLNNFISELTLSKLELSLSLGWPAAERAQKQKIAVDIYLRFHDIPKACVTDDLADTYCYDSLIQKIKQATADKEFRLIEHLAHEVYAVIKQELPAGVLISVCVAKQPGIENLNGGVMFRFGDTF